MSRGNYREEYQRRVSPAAEIAFYGWLLFWKASDTGPDYTGMSYLQYIDRMTEDTALAIRGSLDLLMDPQNLRTYRGYTYRFAIGAHSETTTRRLVTDEWARQTGAYIAIDEDYWK